MIAVVALGLAGVRLPPWLRRLITRAIVIVPAAIVTIWYGESGTALSEPMHVVTGAPDTLSEKRTPATLSAYLLGFGAGQLFIGSVSDRLIDTPCGLGGAGDLGAYRRRGWSASRRRDPTKR